MDFRNHKFFYIGVLLVTLPLAIFVWLGFVLTTTATNQAFEGMKPVVTAIDVGHWLAVLVLMGAIIGAFGV